MERIELATQEDAELAAAIALRSREAGEELDMYLLAGCTRDEARALLLAGVN